MRPADYKYSETHEWVKVDGKIAVIGITDYAVKQLSDLVHVELPKVGDNADQGAPFGEVESVKTVADLVSPVTGKVQEINKEVSEHLDLLTDDPFEEGWLVKIKLSNPSELNELMTSKEYQEFIVAAEAEHKEGNEEDDSDDVDEDDFV